MATQSRSFLREAVHHNRPISRQGVLERLFTLWFRGFVYNQIWEDPRVDAEALQFTEDSDVLAISSGGCNILNYLVHQPRRIVAVDLNTSHMCLTRLKLTALKHLPSYEDFYQFFGLGNQRGNLENYRRYIRPNLDDTTRRFWETSSWPGRRVGPKRINYFAKGFYDHAKLGRFLKVAHTIARVTRRDPMRLLQAANTEEQQQFFDQVVAPLFDNRLIQFFTKMPVTVFSLGIPPSQYRVMQDESGGRIVELYRERVRKLTCGFPMEDNYFAWQAFGRKYDPQRRSVPEYLREANYDVLRRCVDRVETHVASLTAYLGRQDDGALDRFVLLDSQDWMPPPVIADLWREIARVGRPGSRIIFRTAGERSPIESALPDDLKPRFQYEMQESRRLHDQDRSAIYGMFHLYIKPE